MQRYQLETRSGGVLEPALTESEQPVPGPGELLIRMRACSLNYRDLLMLSGQSASGGGPGSVPVSDGAGEIVGAGENVTTFKPGDRVIPCFFQEWIDGRFEMRYHKSALGGSASGVLSEYVVAPATAVVPMPEYLSFEEAACLPVAAVTAWQALVERGRLKKGDTVLALGTGGVSVFALQIATAMGARVIITSGSDAKLAKARKLGAWETINYVTNPDWDKVVWELTGKHGADHIIEVGGPGTFGRSMNAVAAGGNIGLIGVLTGFGPPDASLFPLVTRNVDVNGIYVGSRSMFERMTGLMAEKELRPAVDRVFPFSEAPDAYEFLKSGQHFGKVAITI